MNNGYTTIEIDGKTIGIKFGLPSVQLLLKKIAAFPDLIFDNGALTVAGIGFILYSGYVNNCLLKDAEAKLTYEDFMNYTESVANDTEAAKPLNAVIECWGQSREVQKVVDNNKEDVKKKNLIRTKSKATVMAASE
ncbi:MAG: hypothetical protein H0X33_14795 [Taibaiella sp.]|nr:hypothetical protein [Taibaiella sp.]